MSGSPRLAIVVVTYNSADLVHDFVESIVESTAGTTSQLIFADNASTDNTVERIRQLADWATIVQVGRNAGYAAGINAAVAAADEHDAVLILNPDVRLTPMCPLELWNAVNLTGVGIAVPRLVDRHGELIHSMRREPTVLRALGDAIMGAERAGKFPLIGEMVSKAGEYAKASTADWAEGSTQMVGARCWQECGPWDERFFLYSEETEFDLRARDRGFSTMYVPEAKAIHLEGGSSTSPKLWALLVTNRIRLFRMRNGRAKTGAFWAALILREFSRTVIGKSTSRYALAALMDWRLLQRSPGPDMITRVE